MVALKSSRNVLITGFEPFDGDSSNPSAIVARELDGQVVSGTQLHGVVLPCVFGVAPRVLLKQLRALKPELVICLGQAGGRSAMSLERIAINVDDARIPDNAGAAPVDRPVVRGGPAAYWSTLPIKAIALALKEAGVPSEISQTAGTYVCNHTFYKLMHVLRDKPTTRGGFIHIPYAPEQASRMERPTVSLSVDEMIRGIQIAVATSLKS